MRHQDKKNTTKKLSLKRSTPRQRQFGLILIQEQLSADAYGSDDLS